MDVIPAIDLIGGKCSLVKGEYHRQITYERSDQQTGVFRDTGCRSGCTLWTDGEMGQSMSFKVIKAIVITA